MSDNKPLVVYHKISEALDCSDGFASAFVFWLRHGDSYDYVPGMYHKRLPLELFKDREVYFVDFAYDDTEYMDQINSVSESLLVLDHHRTSMISLGTKPYARLDTKSCGCKMAWDLLFPTLPFPLMLDQVFDKDVQSKRLADNEPFMQRLRSMPNDFKVWHKLQLTLDTRGPAYDKFVKEGDLLLAGHNQHCDIIAASAFPIVLGGIEGLAVNANKFYAHDVGELLALKSNTFGASFHFREDNCVEFSLTSVNDFDVEKLAFKYKGGGHINASGFYIPITSFSSIVDLSSKNVSFYLTLQTHIDEFCTSYSAPLFSEQASHRIVHDLAEYLSTKLGSVVDELQIKVTTVRSENIALNTRILLFIANTLNLPMKDSKKRWYHHILPYKIKSVPVYDDSQISELLELARSDNQADTNDFIVNNLLQTVKYRYEATLIDPTAYEASVNVSFPNSNFFIQHKFSV
jgi:hypothetical protein